jgi:hypothetical protein
MIIHLLTIHHKYGTSIWTHKTEQGTINSLHKYVLEWWDDAVRNGADATPPENPLDAIEMYFFEYKEDEYYEFYTSILEE